LGFVHSAKQSHRLRAAAHGLILSKTVFLAFG